ncbi:hypothetical protein C1645_742064 [Glomus cerebriforme]|uniref:Uncharacterized protein n=1 Tax=Glomus cerebriforme TaxID=658196 RepID=A0A397SFL2_9GLOM|nr:hypothetical protein C1645_742064 [Glomus cerebriforme]
MNKELKNANNKVYPLYVNLVFGTVGVGCGIALWVLSNKHVDLAVYNLDINGVIAITGIAYSVMNLIIRTIFMWLMMWSLSRKLCGEGITINELALTTDLCHGRWYSIIKLAPKRVALIIGFEILLLLTDTGYKFGVQTGNTYGVENNITNSNSIGGGLFKEAHCEANYAECLTDMAASTLNDGVATAGLSTLDNWGFLQTFIWQENKNVLYSIPQRPYINADALNEVVSPNLNDQNVVTKRLNALVIGIVRTEVANAQNMNGWSFYGSEVVFCNGGPFAWNDTLTPVGDTIIIDGYSPNCTPGYHHMEIRMELCNGTVEWSIAPGQPVQAWNITNLSNLQCGPVGIDQIRGAQSIDTMQSTGGLYGLGNRLFSLTLIDQADAIASGANIDGWNVARTYVFQRIQVALNALGYVQNAWTGTDSQHIGVHGTTVIYEHRTIVYNSLNAAIASIMTLFIFSGTIFLTTQTYRITWAGTVSQTIGLILGDTRVSLFGACVDNMPKDDGHGQPYYICSTKIASVNQVNHLKLSTNPDFVVTKLNGSYAGIANTSVAN